MALSPVRDALERLPRTVGRLPRALVGALAFLTRLPVGGDEAAWDAFRRTPAAFPLAGYVVGALVAVPFVLSLPAGTTAALYLLAVFGLTGVTHADGLADLADAAAVHERPAGGGTDADSEGGSVDPEPDGIDSGASDVARATAVPERRREVLKDADTGVGGALALTAAVVALALGAHELASLAPPVRSGVVSDGTVPLRVVSTVVAAEVGAKAGMGALAGLGSPAHEGLGSKLVTENSARTLAGVCLTTAPAIWLAGPEPRAVGSLAAVVLAGTVVALAVRRWAEARIGGVSGDAFGAANELGRVAAVHVGVISWTAV